MNSAIDANVLHLPENTLGRDFIIGDVHGCFDHLKALLVYVDFNPATDRLISCGDLIDRGPESIKCLDALYLPYMWSVMGNHEHMMIGSLVGPEDERPYWRMMWMRNGGTWSHNESPDELYGYALDLQRLPLIIAVGEGERRFNVLHAEMVGFVTDEQIDNFAFTEYQVQQLLWGRKLTRSGDLNNHQCSLTFVGHSPCTHPVKVGQQMYLDGGMGYTDAASNLFVACPQQQLIYKINKGTKAVRTISFDAIDHLSGRFD